MKEKLLAYYLNDLNRLKDLDMSLLDQWIEDYPYCQNLHFLKAKKYQMDNRLDDLQVFHKASTYSTDRSILYSRLVNSEVERTKYIIEFRKKMLVRKEEKAKAKKEKNSQLDLASNGNSNLDSKFTIEKLEVEDPFEKDIIEEKSKEFKKEQKAIIKEEKKEKAQKKLLKKVKLKSIDADIMEEAEVKEEKEKEVKKKKKVKKAKKEKKEKNEKQKKGKKKKKVKKEKKVKKIKKRKEGKKNKKKKKGRKGKKDTKAKKNKKRREQKKNKKNKEISKSYIKDLPPSSEFSKWLMGLQSATSEEKKKNQGIFQKVSKREKKRKEKKRKFLLEQSKINQSLILQEDIVSESLALLLASQGHTRKAIEMYEKLSLVFPQKSSFFAVQIEKLRKK
jgi:hypothetical protein